MNKGHLFRSGDGIGGSKRKDEQLPGHSDALDISRLNVFIGWLVSMLGILLYCLALFGEDPSESFISIFEHGWVGCTGISLMVTGVLQWIYGAVNFLMELERGSREDQP